MGRGTNDANAVSAIDGAGGPADSSDATLIGRIRRGDDRAFEVLYQRYHRRIHAYVLGMVKDHGRAEDMTQEVFLSALRRMRETEQPLAFKPWLYQIAKNSCIDAFRRSKRAEEVSYDADDGLAPADHSKLVAPTASPDAVVAAKQDLDSLCGAFGGLSATHHEILVLRELEGLSYQEIGARMGMSRPAVESTLFRARRRLTEEFDDIVSGARCRRIQGIIVNAADSRLGARDTRRLARHLSHCQPCRREAVAAGVDRELLARPSVRERVATKVAGILPFPAFAKHRREADAAAPPSGGKSASFMQHVPMLSDHVQSGWGKAAAGAAVLVASVGTGVGIKHAASTPAAPAAISASPQTASSSGGKSPQAVASATTAGASTRSTAGSADAATGSSGERSRSAVDRATSADDGPAGAAPKTLGDGESAGGDTEPPASSAPATTVAATESDSGSNTKRDETPAAKTPASPAKDVPKAAQPVKDAVKQTAENVGTTVGKTTDALNQTTQQVTNTLNETTQQATQAVDGTVGAITGPGPVADTVNQTTDVVDNVVGGTGKLVGGLVGGVGQVLDGLTRPKNPGAGG